MGVGRHRAAGRGVASVAGVVQKALLLPWSAALKAVFWFYAAGCLLAYLMADRRATVDELFAVGTTFTLLAWGFAYLYVLMQAPQPGCFAAAVNPQWARTGTKLISGALRCSRPPALSTSSQSAPMPAC